MLPDLMVKGLLDNELLHDDELHDEGCIVLNMGQGKKERCLMGLEKRREIRYLLDKSREMISLSLSLSQRNLEIVSS